MYTSTSTHLLIFPYPAQGHMLALLDLTHHLSLHNFTITILVTPKNLPILTPLLNSHPRIQTLLLPFPSHPSIPPGVENVKELGNAGNFPVMSALVKLFDPIIHWFHSHPNPPVAIISDFFLGWTLDLARHLNIIRIAFFSVSALLPSVFDYCWNHFHDVKSSSVVELHGLPKSPIFKQEQLPSVFRRYKESDPDSEFVKDCLLKNTLSWGCVFNSFEDLEGEYLDYLKTKIGHSRVFGIGPISLLGTESKSANDPNLSPNDYSLKWLEGARMALCFTSASGGCEGADSVPDSIELGRVISQAMNQCGEVKVRAKELKERALAAVKSGGSSAKDLERLVQELKNLQDK
ncbi:hypothetical protein Patl1_16622 [Pistacia atlantica]|uniref:Uncharacterized protein n=1 Tax=Pistacia atlantica TaxID=434234 RepID=A0ACC1BB91_9ROSI|nr:hypothetical protein Patl1_16622 [Pistacia atlantica]